jgi:hypothetical protein
MAESSQHIAEQAEKLYEQYGKPLEQNNRGKYVAILPDGRFVLGESRLETLEKALAQFGPRSFFFKVGDKAVGRWR